MTAHRRTIVVHTKLSGSRSRTCEKMEAEAVQETGAFDISFSTKAAKRLLSVKPPTLLIAAMGEPLTAEELPIFTELTGQPAEAHPGGLFGGLRRLS